AKDVQLRTLKTPDDEITFSDDARLRYNPKPGIVQAYFERLCLAGILSQADVDYLLSVEFTGFDTTEENRVLYPACNKNIIMFFVHQFVSKYCQRSEYRAYREMLMR